MARADEDAREALTREIVESYRESEKKRASLFRRARDGVRDGRVDFSHLRRIYETAFFAGDRNQSDAMFALHKVFARA